MDMMAEVLVDVSMATQLERLAQYGGGEGMETGVIVPYNETDSWPGVTEHEFSRMFNEAYRDPDGIDSQQLKFRNNLTYYLMGIGGSTVCCLGTIANALSVAVLTRRAMRSSTYTYLAALAICDSLVLFFTLLLILKDTRPPDSPHHLDQFHAVLFPVVHPTAIVFQVSSIWLTLAFTVDRYIMICHPFKAERMCRRSRARKVVIGIYIGGLLFNIPRYLEYYTKSEDFRLSNSSQVYTIYGIETTDLGKDELFREFIHSWLYLVCVCGIPFLTLVVLNAFLIRAVHLSRLKGKELNAREKHRNDTTIMLIGVIIIFLICQGPALVSRMIYAFNPGTTKDKNIFTLNEVGSFLVILNSAINIVPYYLFGRKFRSEFWRLFCTCLFDKDELRRIVRSYSNSLDQRRLSQYNVMEMNGVLHNNGGGGGGGRVRDACSGGRIRKTRDVVQGQTSHPSTKSGDTSWGSSATKTCISSSVCSVRKNEAAEEGVATPLVHCVTTPMAPGALYRNGHAAGTSESLSCSKESLTGCYGGPRSRSSSSQPLTPTGFRAKVNGQAQYMTTTAGPGDVEAEWSAV